MLDLGRIILKLQGASSAQIRCLHASTARQDRKCGIVGLPNIGKSLLFNALHGRALAQSANYPFTTIKPNIGVVAGA